MCERVDYIRARMSSRQPPPRPPRTRADARTGTRESLLAAALAAFAADGFDAPSLDAICARAGLTRGAFYVHFADREALVVAVVGRVVARFLDAVLATGDAAADLLTGVRRFADTVDRAADAPARRRRSPEPLVVAGLLPLHRILEAASRSPAIRTRLVEITGEALGRVAAATAAGQLAGTVRRDVEAGVLAAALVALALGVLVGAEVGVPLDVATLRDGVLALVAPVRRR